MYTEQTIMRYGKFRSKKLADVPADYLKKIYASRSVPDTALYEYIEAHKEQLGLYKERKDAYGPFAWTRKRKIFCDKVAYLNEQWARRALDGINHQSKVRRKARMRCYYCERCGLWHLTSMSLEVWQAEPAKRKAHHQLK